MARREPGEWSVGSHRDLESVLDIWKQVYTTDTVGIIHVGFSRPDSSAFNHLAQSFKGKMLLSAPAKYVFERVGKCTEAAIDVIDGIPFFIALSGWGYEITPEEIGLHGSEVASQFIVVPSEIPSISDWLFHFRKHHYAEWGQLDSAGIADDPLYLALENKLPLELRMLSGYFRFNFLLLSKNLESPHDMLSIAPPWVLNCEIRSFAMAVRPKNVLIREKVKVVNDILAYSDAELKEMTNMGRKSVIDIAISIRDAVEVAYERASNAKPSDAPTNPGLENRIALARSESGSSSLVDFIKAFLDIQDPRTGLILRARMGFEMPRQTLREVGETLNLSHERTRQLETIVCQKARENPFWKQRVEASLLKALSGRDSGLPLVGLDVLDPWFKGIEAYEETLNFILTYFGTRQLSIVRINDIPYVSEITQSEWNTAARMAYDLFEDLVGNGISLSESKRKVSALLIGRGEELREELFSEVSKNAFFSTPQDQSEPVLISFGKGARTVVEAILSESERPLHFREISDRSKERGKPIDAKTAHILSQKVGYLFGSGTYGLWQHFPLSDQEAEELISSIEETVYSNPTKQWHCAEIYEMLCDADAENEDQLNPYLINMALHKSGKLVSLKRMVWTADSTRTITVSDRIDIRQAVETLLLEAGTPLSEQEVRERLLSVRGVAKLFQIIQTGNIIRVKKGILGLLDRDIPLTDEQKLSLFSVIEDELTSSQKAIHLSEILGVLENRGFGRVDIEPRTIFLLAKNTGRFKITDGGYLGLPNWTEHQRIRIPEALIQVMENQFPEGGSILSIKSGLQSLVGREIPRESVYKNLTVIGATFSRETDLWSFINSENTSAFD